LLQFAYPWIFLLLPIPFLIHWLAPAHQEPRLAVYVPFMHVLTRRRRLQRIQVVLVWIAVVAALARPQWLGEPIVREEPRRDLLVALDLSGSMDTRDFTNALGEQAERLDAAKDVLDEFLSRRDGDRGVLRLCSLHPGAVYRRSGRRP
jgi:Ca-activated chloride channel family protein